MTLGFSQEVDVYSTRDADRRQQIDDGAGGTLNLRYKINSRPLSARVCQISGEDERAIFGQISGDKWVVLIDGDHNIEKADEILVSDKAPRSPLKTNRYYLVVYKQPRLDRAGNIHHLHLIVEETNEDMLD